jgi:hypothetical protein
MANDIIDINVTETVDSVSITVNPNLTTVNINKVTGGLNQTLQSVTDLGATTTNNITANKFIKSGGVSNEFLMADGSVSTGGGGGGATNLSPTQTATNFTINSDTGTDATIPLGNGSLAGATLNDYTTAEKNKLAGIATGAEVNVNADWNATSGDAQILNKPTIPSITNLVPYTGATTDVNLGLNDITAAKLIKDGGFDYQFLKADGSVDNNTYLTSADLPATLDLYATTTASDISGYTVLVRNIADTRFNTTAVDVSTGIITSVGQLVGSLITDANIISGNPGVFDFKTIGNISRTSGTGQAEFFFRIYKRNLAGTETLIAQSDYTLPVTNGGYVEFSATALWNDGIFLDTDRIVLKYYANRLASPVGSDPTYQFQFGGASPVRSSAAIPTSVMPNIYLRDLADVENVDALNNEILYWNDSASLWEHSLAENLVPLATATQKGLVSTTTQTFAGSKTFTGTITSGTVNASSINDYGVSAISQDSDGVSAESNNGNGIVGISTNVAGGVFMTTNGANIAEFKTNFVLKAAIQNNGKITATAGTASTDVVVKSQLDAKVTQTITNGVTATAPSEDAVFDALALKANDSNVVHLTGLETIAGTKTFSSNIVIPATGTPLILSVGSGGIVSGLTTTIYPDLTELSYVKGVTSAIQTQLNAKQDTLTLTTTGSSGAATLVGSTLNIPQYSGGGSSAQTGTIIVTSGTSFTTPSNITTSTVFIIELIGGGGGGAGGASTNQHGSGGGGGGYVYKTIIGLSPSTTYTCAIGAAGNGGAAANNGTAGTSTTLTIGAATYTASGGGAGLAAISSAGGAGGTGTATGGTPDIAITGQAGDGTPSGQSLVTPSAKGGDAPSGWGLGGSSVIQSTNGNAGTGFGSGGSSGKLATFTGGAGRAGIIYCQYFN